MQVLKMALFTDSGTVPALGKPHVITAYHNHKE